MRQSWKNGKSLEISRKFLKNSWNIGALWSSNTVHTANMQTPQQIAAKADYHVLCHGTTPPAQWLYYFIRVCDRRSSSLPVNTESRTKPGYGCSYLIQKTIMIHFWAERCQKYALSQKKLQIEVFLHRISDQSPRWHMSISTLSGAMGLEIWYVLNMKLYENGKIHSLLSWTLPKIRIIPKNTSNKSFWASN